MDTQVLENSAPEPAHHSQGWERFDYSAQDGLALAGRKYGWEHRNSTPVLCLAGLTRNSADFHELAMYLSREAPEPRRVLCLDYRGRGMSARDRNWKNYNPLVEANDVLAGVTAAGLSEAAVVGTSRGGLIAMILSALRPGFLKAVVLNDVGPEIDGRGLVRIRNYLDHGQDHANWRDAAESLRAAGESQFPQFDAVQWMRQAELIFKEKGDKVVRNYDPNLLKTVASINFDLPLPSMWPQFSGLAQLPVMVIRGERSDLLSRDTVDKMHAAHPGLWSVTVPDQGHAPDVGYGDLPERIDDFVARVD